MQRWTAEGVRVELDGWLSGGGGLEMSDLLLGMRMERWMVEW